MTVAAFMSAPKPTCPHCYSQHTVSNGRIHNKKPKFQCQDCKRQFVENPTNKVIRQETKELIDRLLLEKIPLAGIARAAQVSSTWLQQYVNNKYACVPQQLKVSSKEKGKLTLECDEAWSFVDNKGNKQWIWLAMDRTTREIVGLYVGDRSKQAAKELWKSLPPVYPRVFGGNIPPETLDANALFVIRISGHLMKTLFRKPVTGQSAKKVVRLIILSALTILCVKGFLV